MSDRQLILASQSPRRKQLLEEAGWRVRVQVAEVDDGELTPQTADAAKWTTALAWLKARSVRDVLRANGTWQAGWPIVAGDTVCQQQGALLGQPGTEAEAAAMIRGLRATGHRVWTGLCVVLHDGDRRIGTDSANVLLGDVSDADIDQYVASGGWRGKAGGYNLSDRLEAGWPIEYDGHASTIMGMPLPLLSRLLDRPAT